MIEKPYLERSAERGDRSSSPPSIDADLLANAIETGEGGQQAIKDGKKNSQPKWPTGAEGLDSVADAL